LKTYIFIFTEFFVFTIFVLRRMDAAHSSKISVFISPTVPAVYDVFAVAIKETVGFQQPQKCGGEKPHKGRKADCGFS
jgi:hypothetical protein